MEHFENLQIRDCEIVKRDTLNVYLFLIRWMNLIFISVFWVVSKAMDENFRMEFLG